jgi:cellulase
LDYLAKCAGDDCTSASAGDLSFFKIDQKGLNDAASQSWASDDLIADGNAWTVTVPKDIAPGQYVLRHEIIALHSAQDANGAQNYPQCINIEVTGSGTAEPAGVAATELYTATDPGISLSIYNGLTDYKIPGPAVYSGGASGSAPSTGGSSSAASSAATTSAASSAPVSSTGSSNANTTAAATTSEDYPEPTGEPTFAGSASSTPCTTTITLTGSASATATATETSAPVDTSDNSDDDSEDNSSSGSSDNTPTATSSAPADVSAVASSLPSSVLEAPIPTETSSSDKEDGRPSKALPEGFTLADLLEWVNYLLSKAYNSDGKHARDVTRR